MWCRLLRDNPAERVARAWSHAMLQHPMLTMAVPHRVSRSDATEQVHHRDLIPARGAAAEPATIIEFARHRSEARASVGEQVGSERCQVLRMPVGIARERRR
jgi:hypothetical protein